MPCKTHHAAMIPVDHVQQRILLIRGQRVILDTELARLYRVITKRLNRQVRRNARRCRSRPSMRVRRASS
jgi:hypothetical protein